MTLRSGWLQRQLNKIEADAETWPDWMRRELRMDDPAGRKPVERNLSAAVGRRVKELRAAAGMSVAELADAVGRTTTFIYNLESGKTFLINPVLFLDLCRVLDADPNTLLGWPKEAP